MREDYADIVRNIVPHTLELSDDQVSSIWIRALAESGSQPVTSGLRLTHEMANSIARQKREMA